jgi:hypothetical protein
VQDVVWAFPVAIPILLPFFFMAALSHDRLVRRLYELHRADWQQAGSPRGFFWRPPEQLPLGHALAFVKSSMTWAFRLPAPLAIDPECRRTLRFLRIGLIGWNVGGLALLVFVLMNLRSF